MFYAWRLRKIVAATDNVELATAADALADQWERVGSAASKAKLATWQLLADKSSYPPTSSDPAAQILLDFMIRNDVN